MFNIPWDTASNRFSIKLPKKVVMQLSAKKTQLLSSNFTLCHLSKVKMVFSWKTFCFLRFVTATDQIPVLRFNKKNQSVFDWRKFVTSFFDLWWFNTLLIAKRYKKYTWNSFKRKVKFLYNLTRPFSWYNKTLHLRHCTLAIVSCRISWSFLFVFFFLVFFFAKAVLLSNILSSTQPLWIQKVFFRTEISL